MRTVLSISVISSLILGIYCQDGRYGDWGNGNNGANGANDAEMGQLNGIYNALIGELQNAPKLAEGPQAKNKGNGDPQLPNAIADSQPGANTDVATSNSPSVTDTPVDTAPESRQKPLPNNNNRFAQNGAPQIGGMENFNPPQPNFQNPSFGGGPNFDGPPNPGSMYFPPPGLQNPYMPPNGPNGNDGYNNYNMPPPTTPIPVGNPNSYGSDNSQLQEMGMGQLGQFFSSMVGELQNAGFNNDHKTAIATAKKSATVVAGKTTAKTAATTTDSSENIKTF